MCKREIYVYEKRPTCMKRVLLVRLYVYVKRNLHTYEKRPMRVKKRPMCMRRDLHV